MPKIRQGDDATGKEESPGSQVAVAAGPNWLSIAVELDALGFNVMPARYKTKAPFVDWHQYQNARTTEVLPQWFQTGGAPVNYWVHSGAISGLICLDVDSAHTDKWWRSQLDGAFAAIMDAAVIVESRKGRHYWFRLGPGLTDGFSSWSYHNAEVDLSWDVRANKTGMIVPPSVHETGHEYRWIWPDGSDRPISTLTPSSFPEVPDLLQASNRGALAGLPEGGTGGAGVGSGSGDGVRSMLAALLAQVPTEGGRNNWLARVAGHYAKEYRTRRDAYDYHVAEAAAKLSPPLGAEEVKKTQESIWERERQKDEDLAPCTANGWLQAGDHRLMTWTKTILEDKVISWSLGEWADFDVIARGVVDDEEAARTYDVTIKRSRTLDSRDALLPGATLADGRKLSAWLTNLGAGILPPDNAWPRSGVPGERLRRFLDSQNPPHFKVVPYLGWDDDEEGFITHEGVIRPDRIDSFSGVRPDPILRNRAPFHYGWAKGGVEEAREVLREILTYHDETVASVFGAWWVAGFLKPQISDRVSQFPVMAIEAPSESGKTKGMFSLLIQLGGNAKGQSTWTAASLRDAIAAHQSGTVWVDDQDSLDHLMQLLRAATGEGSYTKMGEDRTSAVSVKLVAPIVVAGEALGMSDQKALRDRAVMMQVGSPGSRRSLKTPGEPQWHDVEALISKYDGDLTQLAGTIVAMALSASRWVRELGTLRSSRGGDSRVSRRVADKHAILRVGARMLAEMTGDPWHVDVVDHWLETQTNDDEGNSLTLKLIPQALVIFDWPEDIRGAEFGRAPTPVYIERAPGQPPRIWVNAKNLATWWRDHTKGRVVERTESEQALQQQLAALAGTEKQFKRTGGQGRQNYWRLSVLDTRACLDRAESGKL